MCWAGIAELAGGGEAGGGGFIGEDDGDFCVEGAGGYRAVDGEEV